MFNSHSVDSLNLLCLTPSTKSQSSCQHTFGHVGERQVGAKTRPYLSHMARSSLFSVQPCQFVTKTSGSQILFIVSSN